MLSFTIMNLSAQSALSAMDLNLLVVFDAVLAERSVTRAAKRLHVTPPAISNALSRLRGVLRDPIVTRSGRGIVPTSRALQLWPAVARALRDLDQAIHGDIFDPKTSTRQFTLAVADAGQIAWLPRLAASMTQVLPRARLRVVNVDTMVALGGLAGTDVDVAVGVSSMAPGIHRRSLYKENYGLVVRRDHPRIVRGATKSTLAEARYLDVQIAFGHATQEIERAFARLGVTRDIAAIVPTFTAAVALVAATDLVATIPASVVDVLGPALGVHSISSPLKMQPIAMHLSWHERTHVDPAMLLFRDLVGHAAKS